MNALIFISIGQNKELEKDVEAKKVKLEEERTGKEVLRQNAKKATRERKSLFL